MIDEKNGGGEELGSQLIKIYQVYTRVWQRLFVFASKSMIRLVNILEFFHCSLFGDPKL